MKIQLILRLKRKQNKNKSSSIEYLEWTIWWLFILKSNTKTSFFGQVFFSRKEIRWNSFNSLINTNAKIFNKSPFNTISFMVLFWKNYRKWFEEKAVSSKYSVCLDSLSTMTLTLIGTVKCHKQTRMYFIRSYSNCSGIVKSTQFGFAIVLQWYIIQIDY